MNRAGRPVHSPEQKVSANIRFHVPMCVSCSQHLHYSLPQVLRPPSQAVATSLSLRPPPTPPLPPQRRRGRLTSSSRTM